MYKPTDKSQFQAQAIMYGTFKLAPVHQDIMDWITKQFGVRALDFSCEKRETSKGVTQQLIHVILETEEDVKQIQANRDIHALIAGQFLKYFTSPAWLNAIPDPLKCAFDANPFPEIIVTYRPLKQLSSEILQEILRDEKRDILETFESVWTISQRVVFYYTDAQIKENLLNGTSTKINEELVRVDIKHGFSGSPTYSFDSKESFDRDYESKWHYYWK
jgi:hypothetical protein